MFGNPWEPPPSVADLAQGDYCERLPRTWPLPFTKDQLKDIKPTTKPNFNLPRAGGPLHVHISDIIQLLRCERAAVWGSRLGMNLRPVRPPRPFVLGEAFHAGVQHYYQGQGWEKWARDVFVKALTRYTALGGVLDQEIEREWTEDLELCLGMLNHYVQWATGLDHEWEVIDMEHAFHDIPIPGIDPAQAVLDGRIDGVLIHKPTGSLWLREYKTARSIPEEQRKIEKDLQARVYCYVVSQMMGKTVAGIEYRFAQKSVPAFPAILKNGSLSKALTGDGSNVTVETFLVAFQAWQKLESLPTLQQIAAAGYGDYYAALKERGNTFFVQYKLHKTRAEMDTAMALVARAVRRVLNGELTTDNWHSDWFQCNYCAYRNPCDRLDNGHDIRLMLKHEYRENVYDVIIQEQPEQANSITGGSFSPPAISIEW
jgi:hypothetical protein